MYKCAYCGKIFEEPKKYYETTEFWGAKTTYEELISPCCKDGFVETFQCDCCGEYITGDYILTQNNNIYCEDCYEVRNIDDNT